LNIKNIAKDNSHPQFINVLASLPFLVLNFWQPWLAFFFLFLFLKQGGGP
jgi:hypothetical protein